MSLLKLSCKIFTSFSVLASIQCQAETNKKVVVGVASNFSQTAMGGANPFGDYLRNGVKLSMKVHEKALAKAGIRLELEYYDYGNSQAGVLDTVTKAVSSEAVAIIGYNYSSQALLAAPIHQKNEIPMLAPIASATRLQTFGPYVHSLCVGNPGIAKAMSWVNTSYIHAKRAIIISAADCAYCQDLAQTFMKEFKANGGVVVKKVDVLQEQVDFSNAWKEVEGMDYDLVVVPNQEITSGRIVSEFLKRGYSKYFLGGDAWGDLGQGFYSVVGKLKKALKSYSVTHWHAKVNNELSRDFVKNYWKEFGKPPAITSAQAYDSMSMLIQILVNSKFQSREEVERGIANLRRFNGLTGTCSFNNGIISKDLVLLRQTGNEFEFVRTISVAKEK